MTDAPQLLNNAQLREQLAAEAKAAGGRRAWARAHGVPSQTLDHFLNGTRPAEPRLLAAIGLTRFYFYGPKP